MGWLSAPGYWLSRLVFTRALALIYLIAFISAANQFRPLIGERGMLPVPRYLAGTRFRRSPSLFYLRYSDRLFGSACWVGAALAAAALVGAVEHLPLWGWIAVWLVLWCLYLSIVNVGQVWYRFGWEMLLVETGFLAVFLGPAGVAPPRPVLWLLRWLLVRVELGAGLIKLRGDTCWRDLTCLRYHHETQPMPNPLSWYFHRLPPAFHRVEVLANHATQLVIVFGVLAPQPVAGICALVIIATQAWLMLSGNFAWLNALTLAIAVSVVDGRMLHKLVAVAPPARLAAPGWHQALVVVVTVVVAVLSYWPARNLLSRHQRMNASFNSLHLVNSYGAFGHVTRVRHEVIVEGTDSADPGRPAVWKEYEFKGKPGDPGRRPPQVAPYHLRLDWLMWFVGISTTYGSSWLHGFLVKLLENDRATLRLLRSTPFPDHAPHFVRASLYRYRFTSAEERRATGAWWVRTRIGELVAPMSLGDRVAG